MIHADKPSSITDAEFQRCLAALQPHCLPTLISGPVITEWIGIENADVLRRHRWHSPMIITLEADLGNGPKEICEIELARDPRDDHATTEIPF